MYGRGCHCTSVNGAISGCVLNHYSLHQLACVVFTARWERGGGEKVGGQCVCFTPSTWQTQHLINLSVQCNVRIILVNI